MEKETTMNYGRLEFVKNTSGYDRGSTEEDEMLTEIKELNKNIKGLRGDFASLLNGLNYLKKEQEKLSEEQELMEMDSVYEKYGKPLEKEHKGDFACITPEGDYALGKTSIDALNNAEKEGLENFILFRIGEKIYV